jgi:4Fe-4S ferredoxin
LTLRAPNLPVPGPGAGVGVPYPSGAYSPDENRMAAYVLGLPSPMVEDPASEAAESRLLQGSRDPVKARRAARDPLRTGERCRAPALAWVPIVDREKCEGKQECVDVCPYSVFELGVLTDAEYAALSFTGRIKARRHDRRTARTPQAAACRACGLCVVACPEDAITLTPTTAP